MFPLPRQEPVELRRHPQKARHRPERQLQADGRGGIGVLEQNQEQRRQQGRGAVALPLEEGRRQQQDQHHAGAHHRRAAPGKNRVKHQQADHAPRQQLPAVAAHQQLHQRQQESAVHTGHRQDVQQPRLRQVPVGPVGEAGGVPRQDRAQKGRHIAAVKGIYLLPHGVAQPDGPPPGHVRRPAGDHRLSPLIGQQVDPLGGKGGDVVVPDAGGVSDLRRHLHSLARPQRQQLRTAIVHDFSRQALRLRGDPGAVVGGLRVIAQGQRQGALLPAQGLHRPLDVADIQPVPPQGQGQAGPRQQHPPAPDGRQKQPPPGQEERRPGAGQQPRTGQQVLG